MTGFKEEISFNLYFQNSVINSKDYANPVKRHILNLFKLVQMQSSKIVHIFIRPDQVNTDSGLIFENMEENKCLGYDVEENDV
jgi:hypothetical protein